MTPSPVAAAPSPAAAGPSRPAGAAARGLNRAALYRLAGLAAAVLPRPLRLGAAAGLGRALAARLPRERAVVEAALARIVPGARPGERAALVRDVFRHFAMCFADLVSTNRGPRPDRLVGASRGVERLDAVASGGVIALTAHVGNWELGGRLLAGRLGRPTHVVMAPETDPGIERLLRRPAGGLRYLTRHHPTAGLELLAALRRGEVVAMQGDRPLGARGDVAVPFFGAPARFPLGPFLLARAARVPVVPSFCLLDEDRRYSIVVGSPLTVPAGDEPEALRGWVAELEAVVRAHPQQWFNFFDVWEAAGGR